MWSLRLRYGCEVQLASVSVAISCLIYISSVLTDVLFLFFSYGSTLQFSSIRGHTYTNCTKIEKMNIFLPNFVRSLLCICFDGK